MKRNRRHIWLQWLAAVTGLASLAWFLVRVIPKPSRAAYPCQRAAAPLASGFVIWFIGLVGARAFYRRATQLRPSPYGAAAVILAMAGLAVWLPLGITFDASAQAPASDLPHFAPVEPANQPMGVAKGIHPGRVAWLRDEAATKWDGKTGDWWDEANTDQKVVNAMVSSTLRSLTGDRNDKQAWNSLFRHFNQTHKLGKGGYQRGEKIAIKINSNQDRPPSWRTGQAMNSPQGVHALLDQLINVAGVRGEDITIYDAARYIGDPIYNKVHADPNPNFQAVRFVVNPKMAKNGRLEATPDKSKPLHFADAGIPTAYLPECVTEAKYLINVALLRGHTLFAVTATAKNHFGSVFFPDNGGWTPAPMHAMGARDRPVKSFNPLVELNGHNQLSGKTLLFMIDGLYGAPNQGANVVRFKSFGDDWSSSIFMSQDQMVIDSVAVDILRNEPNAPDVRGSADNYLHEAALAGNAPSGTVYDPERDGTRLTSLGVHEHWNNPADKQYSRNLSKKGEGIELVTPRKLTSARRGN